MRFCCPKCGNHTEQLVTNTKTWQFQCWKCVAGPDCMVLRRIELETETGFEIHLVHAVNNLEAFKMLSRPDVRQMIATPLYN